MVPPAIQVIQSQIRGVSNAMLDTRKFPKVGQRKGLERPIRWEKSEGEY